MTAQTNPTCVNHDNRRCDALIEIHKGCFKADCPFYKTDYDFKVSEARARRRCDALGIPFKTRDEVIDDMDRASTRSHNKAVRKNAKKVVQYNTSEHSFTEYESLLDASDHVGIPVIKLELLIKKNETYNGYRYVYI